MSAQCHAVTSNNTSNRYDNTPHGDADYWHLTAAQRSTYLERVFDHRWAHTNTDWERHATLMHRAGWALAAITILATLAGIWYTA